MSLPFPARAACSAAFAIAFVFVAACGDSTGPNRAANIDKVADTDNQTASIGRPVTLPPSVIVTDAEGNPVGSATVTFAVASGGGQVTGEQVQTDAQGRATVGSWIMGPEPGTNTLTAAVGGVDPVTFTANAVDPCAQATDLPLGGNAAGQLTTQDCLFANVFYTDLYVTPVPVAQAVRFSMNSPGFDNWLEIYTFQGSILAVGGGATTIDMKLLLEAGDYVPAASSYEQFVTGSYEISAATTESDVSACERVWIAIGVSTNQVLESTDCQNSGPRYSDDFLVVLPAGVPVTITMTSENVDSYLELISSQGLVASDDNSAGGSDAMITFTSPETNVYLLGPTTANTEATGAYTLSIQAGTPVAEGLRNQVIPEPSVQRSAPVRRQSPLPSRSH